MLAVEFEGPGVIRAAEKFADTAVTVGHQFGALVRAAVVQHADLLVGAAHHDHVLIANARGVIVAGVLHLAYMADVDPGVAVDTLHFQLEQGRVGVDALVNAVLADQGSDLLVGRYHGMSSACHRSSTSSALLARETQVQKLPLARSRSDRQMSR
ncbi:hypothetical protein D3C72_768080 [compost metagenome]